MCIVKQDGIEFGVISKISNSTFKVEFEVHLKCTFPGIIFTLNVKKILHPIDIFYLGRQHFF